MTNKTQVAVMAERLSLDPVEMQNIVVSTIMPSKGNITNEQFVSFLAVANEYKLNPLTKEIYAFPGKGGSIQPIVSIDGWLKIINTQKDFNGMVHEDVREDGQLVAVTCKIYKKGMDHPVSVTEYMDECKGSSEPWRKWPARMLRHKATIQAGRYAFGLSGIIDPDEADRFEQAGVIAKEEPEQLPPYTDEAIEQNIDKWQALVDSGKKTPQDIINSIESRFTLTDDQKMVILGLEVIEAEYTEESA